MTPPNATPAPPELTAASRAFFTALTPPVGKVSSPSTDALYDALLPIHELVRTIRTRISDLQLLLMQADSAEENIGVYGKFERFKQGIQSTERELQHLTNTAQGLADIAFQMDQMAIAIWDEFGLTRPE